ncbi:MAG: prolipoprotein diacylglyceryl transferase, partial [Clostridia bacterium]|nr:prolipoprotein diacylglyceryl transferase [Clostridia bacterium]
MTNYISFPGLGIDEFSVKEVAFSLFGRDVAWYGVIITVGIILACMYVMNRAKYYEGIKEDDVLDLALYIIPLSIIGARLYYVLTSLDQYDSFMEMIAIWEGGLAIYGAVIGGALTALVFCLIKKINVLKMYDMLVPAVMIGQIVGRWGNFVNAEAHGGVTDVFIRMDIRTETM